MCKKGLYYHFYLLFQKLCIIASNNTQSKFRVLNIDRTEPLDLVLAEESVEYTQEQVWEIVQALDPGGRSRGYTSRAVSAFGIVGILFIAIIILTAH